MTELRQRKPRQRNEAYLKWLRKQYCSCGCLTAPPSDAAHIRAGSINYGKRPVGLQEKPDDRWAVPLNRSCHGRQHAFGDEMTWWARHGKDPFATAMRFNAMFAVETGKTVGELFDPPASKDARPRKRAQATFAAKPKRKWPKGRKLQSRGFR